MRQTADDSSKDSSVKDKGTEKGAQRTVDSVAEDRRERSRRMMQQRKRLESSTRNENGLRATMTFIVKNAGIRMSLPL